MPFQFSNFNPIPCIFLCSGGIDPTPPASTFPADVSQPRRLQFSSFFSLAAAASERHGEYEHPHSYLPSGDPLLASLFGNVSVQVGDTRGREMVEGDSDRLPKIRSFLACSWEARVIEKKPPHFGRNMHSAPQSQPYLRPTVPISKYMPKYPTAMPYVRV